MVVLAGGIATVATDGLGLEALEELTAPPTATSSATTADAASGAPGDVATAAGTTAPTDPSGDAPTPSPTLDPPAVDLGRELPLTAEDEAVASLVAQVVGSPGLARRSEAFGVAVRDPEGRDVFDLNADVPWLPASTQKVVTAAAALRTWGPQHRFTTEVRGVVDDDGVVTGDLFLVGGGDPTLATADYRTHVYPSRPASEIEALADAVVASGVREVRGGVVGDGTAYTSDTVPPGWKDEYLDDQNGRHVTALTVDAGLDLAVEIPEDGRGPQLTILTAPDPVVHTASRFTDLLRERGVTVSADPRRILAPSPSRPVLGTLESPPLTEILTFMMQRSDNHLADTVFRSLASRHEGGDGSWDGASNAALAVLDGLGVDTTGVRPADGSGLSRDDRVTGDAMAELDAVMYVEEPSWPSLMAVAGRSGTLRNRLRGTVADGRVRGKTGTLDDVKAVELAIEGRDGAPRYHVAVLSNARTDRWVAQVLMDELALRIVEALDGCQRVPTGEPPAQTEPPSVVPYELVCPGEPVPGPDEPEPPTSPTSDPATGPVETPTG